MNKELISTAVARRLDELRERANLFDPETFGDAGFFLTSVKELLLDHPNRASSLTPFSPPAEWVAADTDCLTRSEEHTSELQSQSNLVCRLLLEKKKKKKIKK